MSSQEPSAKRHFTTRRRFITAAGFGVVGLYGLWAAYGAAPLPFRSGAAPVAGDDHGAGHGAEAASGGMTAVEFRTATERFVNAHALPDGSVSLLAAATASLPQGGAAEHTEHAGHGEPLPPAEGPSDVYLMATRFAYAPGVLRLRANVPYRFRMMAVDITHGMALQLGRGAHVLRLRSNALIERELRFTAPGEYLVYCTVYCGLAHDRMQGKIIVA